MAVLDGGSTLVWVFRGAGISLIMSPCKSGCACTSGSTMPNPLFFITAYRTTLPSSNIQNNFLIVPSSSEPSTTIGFLSHQQQTLQHQVVHDLRRCNHALPFKVWQQ